MLGLGPRRTRRPLRIALRSPRLLRLIATALALAALAAVARAGADADARAAAWGRTVDVLVVVGDHRAGDALLPADVVRRSMPRSLSPTDVLTTLPAHARLAADVGDREILVRTRLAATGSSRLAALVPPGHRAVAIARPDAAIDLAVGDRVDLVALGSDGHAGAIAPDASVVAVSRTAVTVTVESSEVGAVAEAAAAQTLSIALRGS